MVSASDREPKVVKVWQLRLPQQIRKETQIIKFYCFSLRVFGHKFLIMSDLLTKALGCYSEIVQYFSKNEHIHLGHKFEDLGKSVQISFKFYRIEKDGRIPVIPFSVIIMSESKLNTWIGTLNTIQDMLMN